MATLEQLKQALYNADQAGDFEAASTLAAAIQNMQTTVQGPPQRPGEVAPQPKQYTLGEQIIGGLEADAALFTGMTSGAVGYISGVVEGLSDQALKGQWKPEEIEKTAEAGAERLTYTPRTDAGKEITQRVGGMLTNLMAFGPHPEMMTGDIGAATSAAKPYVQMRGKQAIDATSKVAKPVVEKTTNLFKKELPKKPDEVAVKIYEASKGDEKAKQIVKEIAPLNEEALQAATNLDIDLPIDLYLKNDEVAKTVGMSRSQVGSVEEAAFKQDVVNTARIADEAMDTLSKKVTNLAEVSDDVKTALHNTRNDLKKQEKVLYDSFDQSLPLETNIVADNLADLLTKTAIELGDEARLTATEKNLLALSKAENLTYGALLRAKNDIGEAVGGKQGLFSDVNSYQLGKIYDAIKEDQKAAISLYGGEDQLANLKLANALTIKRKAVEQSILDGFGKKGTGSIARLIENSIKSGSKGDVANLNKLLSIVPADMQRDVVATALKDLSTSKKAANLGEFDFTNYAKTYEGLRQNAPIYSQIIKVLGEDKAQMLQDLYVISKRINEAKQNVLHTGKANQTIIAGLKGNTILQNIVGKVVGWTTQKVTAGLVSPDFMFKTPQDKLQAIADLMRNPDFKQMIIDASQGKNVSQSVAKVMETEAYKRAAKAEKVSPEPAKPTPQEVKEKVEAKKTEKAKPTKEEVKKKVEEKKAEKKPIDAKEEARKEIKANPYLEAYKELILDAGKATTKAERNKSHNWFDVPVEDDFGQTVATKRIAGQRDITEAFTADKASIDRFMKGKATVEDLKAIKHDLNTFELNSDLRDEASILRANKSNESVELSDGSIYDPFSKMTYSKKEWQDLMDEAMFSKSPAEQSRLEEWHKYSAPETKNEDGTPKVFYHGTTNSFDKFDPKRVGETDSGWYGKGYYFTSISEDAENYAGGRWNPHNVFDDGGNIMPVYLNIKNPKIIKERIGQNTTPQYQYEKELIKQGHDGVIVKRYDEDGFYNDEYIVFDPTQIKSVFNKGTFSESNPNILMSKDKAFNSVLKDAIDSMPNKMNTEAFKSYLKGKGVKDDEINFSGIKDILDKPTVTKAEVLANYAEPNLKKKVLGNNELVNEYNRLYDLIAENPEKYPKDSETYNKWLELKDKLSTEQIGANATKFEAYKTPNVGTNYREVLTTMPNNKTFKNELFKIERVEKVNRLSGSIQKEAKVSYDGKHIATFAGNLSDAEIIKMSKKEAQSEFAQFKSSHWDEPNVLYHTRLQDTTIGKEKTLLVEEIQSDWHQEGRKQGYRADKLSADEQKRLEELRRYQLDYKREFTTKEANELYQLENKDRASMKGTPQAPYSKTWHEKAMKDIIDEAVKNGYDRVAWTVGKTQADRYSLAKQVDRISYDKLDNGEYQIITHDKKGQLVFDKTVSENELPNIFGKEMANKIIKGEGKQERFMKILEGLDLEVGGEGMKGFYDKILPDFTNKYIKKYGSKIEKKTLSNGDEVWSFEVTDKMKEDISGKGQSLFSQFKTKNATTKQEAQTIAQNLLGKHYAKHADTFEIVQSVEDLPQNIKDALYSVEAQVLKSGGKARGIFDPKSGKAYIIADAMKANEVEGVILHELLHKNINNEVKAGKSRAEAIMGSRYESVVRRLDNLYKMGDKQVKDAFQKVTDANTPVQHRIEEVMTYLLENITNESKPLLIKWKDDVIASIKAFIAKTALQLGMKAEAVMSKLDSNDIANILRSEAIKNESMLKNIKR